MTLGDTGLRLIVARCGDVSVSVRKAAVVALSSLFAAEPWHRPLQTLWLAGVVPLSSDPESSVQAKCLDMVQRFIVEPLLEWHANSKAALRKQARASAAAAAAAAAAEEEEDTNMSGAAGGGSGSGDGDVSAPSTIEDLGNARLADCDALWSLLNGCGEHPDLVKTLCHALRNLHKSVNLPVKRVFHALVHAANMSADKPPADVAPLARTLSTSRRASMCVATWILFEALAPQLRACRSLDVAPLLQCWYDAAPKRGDRTSSSSNASSSAASTAASADIGMGVDLDMVDMDDKAAMGASAATAPPLALSSALRGAALHDHAARVLSTLAAFAAHMNDAQCAALRRHLLAGLCAFRWVPAVSAAAMQVMLAVTAVSSPSRAAATAGVREWAAQLLATCASSLRQYVSLSGARRPSGLDVALRLFIVGEVAMLGIDGKASANTAGGAGGAGGSSSTGASAQEDAASFRAGVAAGKKLVVAVPVPKELCTVIQTLLAPVLTAAAADISMNGSAAAPSKDVQVPEQVRAHAVVALGKLCLLDYGLAKQYVSVLVRELGTPSSPVAVRNNILFVLSDLCVRYTQLVDRHVPAMATCIHDPHPVVRRHTLMLLTHLLVEDYVKWRSVLVFHFLTALADDSADVRTFAESAMTSVLLQKFPNLFASNFVDVLVVLQGCRAHPNYSQALHSLDGYGYSSVSLPTALVGPRNVRRRMHIYRTMLRHMTDEQRFTASARVVHDILGGVVDGVVKLPAVSASTMASAPSTAAMLATPGALFATPGRGGADAGGSVAELLREAFAVLSCSEIRLSARARRGATEADASGLDVTPAQAALAAAKGKVMSKLHRKNTVENVVPVLIALKGQLQKGRSPLLGPLMRFMKTLFSDYKQDVSDMLAADPQLAQEVEYDLRRFEEQEQAEARSRAAANANASLLSSASGLTGLTDLRSPAPRRRSSGAASARGTPVHTPRNPFSPRTAGPVTPGRVTPGALAAAKAATSPGTRALARHTPKIRRRGTPLRREVDVKHIGFTLAADDNGADAGASDGAGAGVGASSDAAGSAAVAPSPVPSHLPIRVYPDMADDHQPQATKAKRRGADVLIPAPDAAAPKPRVWTVRAATDDAADASSDDEDSQALGEAAVVEQPSTSAPTGRVSSLLVALAPSSVANRGADADSSQPSAKKARSGSTPEPSLSVDMGSAAGSENAVLPASVMKATRSSAAALAQPAGNSLVSLMGLRNGASKPAPLTAVANARTKRRAKKLNLGAEGE